MISFACICSFCPLAIASLSCPNGAFVSLAISNLPASAKSGGNTKGVSAREGLELCARLVLYCVLAVRLAGASGFLLAALVFVTIYVWSRLCLFYVFIYVVLLLHSFTLHQ